MIFEFQNSNYIYFRSNCAKLDEQKSLNELKYNFRSMTEHQKSDLVEILIWWNGIEEIISKNYLCNPIAIEIFSQKDNRMHFFNFFNESKKLRFMNQMKQFYMTESKVIIDSKQEFENRKYQVKWKTSSELYFAFCKQLPLEISTFDYLMLVNKYSSRSFNDTSQYPILPWVGPWGGDDAHVKVQNNIKRSTSTISAKEPSMSQRKLSEDPNEDSSVADEDSKSFNRIINQDDFMIKSSEIRNFKLHAGRLTEAKDTAIYETYLEGVNEFEAHIYGNSPFHLKFGFSNSQWSLANLIRVAPFTEIFIDYNGKLDHPDRMVTSYQNSWNKVLNVSQWNLELTPEWFFLPQILTNSNMWYFGIKSDGELASNIEIPKWANSNPYKFVMLQRKFINSEKFTKCINLWIDQLFGIEQQSTKYRNIFFEFWDPEYFKNMNKSIPFDRIKLKSLAEFFQLPGRLFDKRHQQLISKRKSKLEHSANSSSSSSLQPQAESSLNVLNVLETSRVGENEELLNIIPFQE